MHMKKALGNLWFIDLIKYRQGRGKVNICDLSEQERIMGAQELSGNLDTGKRMNGSK